MGKPHTSASALSMLLECPAKYYFCYLSHFKQKISYAMLCGKAVHEFIAGLYRRRPPDRKFFYKSIESARKAWFGIWPSVVAKEYDTLMYPNKDDQDKYGAIGWICIKNYWETNVGRPDPLEMEKGRVYLIEGINLVVVPDQIRSIATPAILRYRPELLTDGVLDRRYAPVAIYDIKTTLGNWEPKPDVPNLMQVGSQFHLSESIQAIAYTWAYHEQNKLWPVGFFFYAVFYNKFYFVAVEDDEHQGRLSESIRFLKNNLNLGDFPKHSTSQCKTCGFLEYCVSNTGSKVSFHKEMPEAEDIRTIFKNEKEKTERESLPQQYILPWGRPQSHKNKR